MGGLSIWHWVIILVVVILLFGAKKLPEAARGVGRSLRILKSEVNAMGDDKKEADAAVAAQAAAAQAAAAQAQAQTAARAPLVAPILAQPLDPAAPVQPIAAPEALNNQAADHR